MSRKEEQISLMKHLYSMQKQRKKYQAKIDDLKDELKKVEKGKLKKEINKLQEDLKNEKAEKEAFKIEAKTYKEENAELKKRIGEYMVSRQEINNASKYEIFIKNNLLENAKTYQLVDNERILESYKGDK